MVYLCANPGLGFGSSNACAYFVSSAAFLLLSIHLLTRKGWLLDAPFIYIRNFSSFSPFYPPFVLSVLFNPSLIPIARLLETQGELSKRLYAPHNFLAKCKSLGVCHLKLGASFKIEGVI